MNEISTSRFVAVWSALVTFSIASFVFCSTFTIAGTQTSLAVAAVLWIVLFAVSRSMPPRRTPLDLPVILFVIVSILAVLFSGRLREGFWNLRNYLLLIAIYLFASYGRSAASLRRLFWVLLVSACASALYGSAIFLLGRGDGTLGRTSGSFSNAMTFGGVMLLLCSLMSALASAPGISRRLRISTAIASVITGIALFFSFTRSSWLGMLVSVLIILAIQRKLFIPIFIAGLVLLIFLMPGRYRERFTSIFDPTYRTNVHRIEMLEGGWRIFREHWMIGVGPIDLSELYEEHKPPTAELVFGHLHNNLLNIAVTLGSVGLAAFVYLFVSIFRLLSSNLALDLPPPERAWVVGSIAAVAGFLVNGLFEWNFADAEVVTLLYIIIASNCSLGIVWARGGLRSAGTHA